MLALDDGSEEMSMGRVRRSKRPGIVDMCGMEKVVQGRTLRMSHQ